MDFRKYAAELLGSFLFFSIGYLSVAAFGAAEPAPAGLLVVPFSFGFGLLAAIFAFGHISGGHFNPAVTVAMVLDRRTTPVDAVGYIVAQVIGALLAGLPRHGRRQPAAVDGRHHGAEHGRRHHRHGRPAHRDLGHGRLHRGDPRVHQARARPGRAGDPAHARRDPLRHRLLSGASVNPARSIGSAVVGGDVSKLWIYIVAPVVGAVLGWLAWKVIDGGVTTIPAEEPGAEHVPD